MRDDAVWSSAVGWGATQPTRLPGPPHDTPRRRGYHGVDARVVLIIPTRLISVAAQLIDGKTIAAEARKQAAIEAVRLTAILRRPPGLTVVLVGDDPASQVYVRNKETAAKNAGIAGNVLRLPADTSEASLLETIDRLNADVTVDGILVQLPLPRGLSEERVIERIDPRKDVDGLHPENVGLLAIGRPRFIPCTPRGIMHLLEVEGVSTKGARAVVLGRSQLVGKPMALLLMRKGPGGDATVTVCHTGTREPAAIARAADILIVAMGQPNAVGADWVKPGAVVIDVGMHRRADGSLHGDVRTAEVAEVARKITPVPGGVGPMTVAMLLQNTIQAAQSRCPS